LLKDQAFALCRDPLFQKFVNTQHSPVDKHAVYQANIAGARHFILDRCQVDHRWLIDKGSFPATEFGKILGEFESYMRIDHVKNEEGVK
jgi:hypothetical protein